MDSFLSDLYRESMEKKAGVELKEFYDSLSIEQLEQVLGLTKEAVEGPACPECPDGSPVKKYLDATEKAPAKKTTPPELPTAGSPTAKTAAVTKHPDGAIVTGAQIPKHFTPEQVAMFHRGMRALIDEEERKGTVIGGKAKKSTVFDQLEGKVAADLTLKKRESLPAAKFAIPEKKAKTAGVVKDLLSAAANRVQKSATPAIDKMFNQQINRKIKDLGPKAMLVGGGLLGGCIATGGVSGYVAGKHSAEKAIVQRKVHAKFPGIGEKSAEAFEHADQMGRMMAKTSGMFPVSADSRLAKMSPQIVAGLLAANMPLTGTVGGALGAPPGERGRGATQGLMTGLGGDVGALGGGVGGYQLAKHLGGGPRAKLLAVLGGGALGAFGGATGGQALGRKIAPFKASPEEVAMYRAGGPFEDETYEGKTAEKRAELLITALRAIKDAPEYVKHAAAKYVGERL